jgi:hypothetical protein
MSHGQKDACGTHFSQKTFSSFFRKIEKTAFLFQQAAIFSHLHKLDFL